MKNLIVTLTIAVLGLMSLTTNAQNQEKTQKVTFECEIDCQGCKAKIMQQLPYEKGVKNVEVSVEKNEVKVEFKTNKNTTNGLIKSLKDLGYTAVIKDDNKTNKATNPEVN